MKLRKRQTAVAGIALAALMGVAACGDDGGTTTGSSDGTSLSGEVIVDGSSTVAPLSTAAAEMFQEENPGVHVTVGTSGTGGGFEKFCRGETDISDASRPIKESEIQACTEAGITYKEFQVANDALTVVVNAENDWATCLTTEELRKIWDEGSTVNNWNQVRPDFPDVPLELFGPGTDSGTFDYFTAEINGAEGRSRTDYDATEDDNVIVTGVSGQRGGMGYFGFTYYEENAQSLKAVEIDSGDGCVAPSLDNVLNGAYSPLSRPLFIYASDKAVAKPQVEAFLEFYLANTTEIAEAAGFIPMNEEQVAESKAELEELRSSAGATEPEPTS